MRLILAALLLPAAAFAQSTHLEAEGDSLAINTPCAAEVSVATDGKLSNRVVLDATASRAEEIAPLELRTEDGRAELRRRDRATCPDGPETLRLAVRIPQHFAVSVDDSGSARYHLPDLDAPLQIDASGSFDLNAGRVSALSVDSSGSGRISVSAATGAVRVRASGSSDIAVGGGDIPALALELSGSGHVRYGEGSIGALRLRSSGDADVTIAATVNAAAINLSGSGTARLHRITGPLSQNTSGSGQVVIEQR